MCWNKGYQNELKVCHKKARERINGITVIITISVLKLKSKGYRSILYCKLLAVRLFNISFHGENINNNIGIYRYDQDVLSSSKELS